LNIFDFLEFVLPSGEHFFIAEVPGSGAPVKHFHASNVKEAARIAVWRDNEPGDSNVYYAMASFKEPSYVGADGKTRKRTQDNVDKLKCFWVDLDCKGRKDKSDYASQKDAVLDIKRFCSETRLPLPTVVNSGYGIHAYWVLDQSIEKNEWKAAAERFRATLDNHGVRHDSNCTTDCARILRPVGTFNKKPGISPREVTLVGTVRPPISLSEFVSKLDAVDHLPLGHDMSLNIEAASVLEYKPSSILEIVKECPLVREVGKLGGNVQEPLWHKTIGLVKFTIEGEKAIHIFSKGHPEYNYNETVKKANAWKAGPTTCSTLFKDSPPNLRELCAKCQHHGKITSPIVLGYQKVLMVERAASIGGVPSNEVIEIPAMPASMQFSFKWQNEKLWRKILDKEATKKEGSEQYEWVPFCDFYLYPYTYYDDENQKHHMVWRLREREGVFKEFTLSGGAMGAGGQALFKELGEHSVTISSHNKPHMEAYITNFVTEVKKKAQSVKTYTNFGWNGDDFLIGDRLIKVGGEISKVRLGGSAGELFKRGYFNASGSVDRWVELIDKLYNYEGQEQFQFILCTGFGSPLLQLMGCDGGAVISAISSGSGYGKSTAGKLAAGIYGDGRSGRITLTLEQASPKAVHAMAGILNGIPIMLDEVTNIDPMAASTIVYTHSQGSGRVVLNTTGALNLGRHSWSSIMNVSANTSIANLIQTIKPGAEAEQARLIEFEIADVSKLPKDTADAILKELTEIKCVVGEKFMSWVQAHREDTVERLTKVQTALDKRLGLSKRDRFWSYTIAGVITGAMIAKEIGLIRFDISNMVKWLESRVLEIREDAKSIIATPEQLFSQMLRDLSPGFIVTDIEGDRRSNKLPTMLREPKGSLTGRVVIETGRLYLPQPIVHQWCYEHQVSMKQMMKEMARAGIVLNNGTASLRSPAKGTFITMGQFRCYDVDITKFETPTESESSFSNVVQLFKEGVSK